MFYEVDMDEQLKFLKAEEREEGREEGLAEGLAEGEARMADLNRYLLSQNRIDDLRRASSDPDFRRRMLDEMESLSE